MRVFSAFLAAFLLISSCVFGAEEQPLRVFIRAGVKTHGPGQHDHPRFLAEWKQLLTERGMKADGSLEFPTAEQLSNTDVLVFYCADGANITPEQRPRLLEFTKRGGGLVVIHDAIVASKDPEFFQQIVGGVWQNGKAKWHEGEVGIYFQDREHPVTKGMANFDVEDEIYYSLNMLPEAQILASSFHDVFNIAPQIWAYEKDNYRALVSIPGHNHTTFSLPTVRTLLLRAIAWTGKRANVDMYGKPEELASLDYPEKGPQRPEKSLEKMVVHPDFNMTLSAAEPLVNKPMNMDWDPQGRMWVAETPEYPQGKKVTRVSIMEGRGYKAPMKVEDRPGRDRISILQDTNGDGVADKKTVFADDLELVTGLVFHKDGVIVTQAPDILWLRDTDGDGKCDKREVLYTGLGTGDTHAVINNPRWGFDGWIYATHGYSGGQVKTADGKTTVGIGSGVCRFKPDGSAIEMYSSKGGNTWGLDIAWDNEVFYTQPTSGELLMHVVLPEYVLAKGKVGKTQSYKALISGRPSIPAMSYKRQAYVQIDQVGRFTASAGCAIYGGGSWPEEWNYNYFTTEPTINIIHHEVVKPTGATYSSEKNREPEFISGKDYWFRPIETRVGPDGALYIIDFYNQAVVHNDTRGPTHAVRNFAIRPDRDHYYGRIWRVDHKQAKKLAVPDLSKATPAELVKALEQPNLHVRNNAMRLLWERGDDAAFGELSKLVADNAKPATARIPALWALYNAKKLNAETLTAAINSGDLAVRKNGVRAANNSGLDVKSALAAKLKDEDARVRLEAIVSLSSMQIDKATATALLEIYPALNDGWSQSAMIALSKNDPVLFCEGAFGLADAAVAEGLLANLAGQAAASDKPDAAARLVKLAAEQPAAKDALKVSVLTALARSGKDVAWSDEIKTALKSLLGSENVFVSNSALPLVARWDKQGALAEDMKARLAKVQTALADANINDEQRAELARTLLSLYKQDPSVIGTAGKLLEGPGSPNFKKQVIQALGGIPEADAGAQMIAAIGKLPADVVGSAVDEIVKREDWSNALIDAIKNEKVKLTQLGPVNVHRLRTHPEGAIAKRANDTLDELRGPEMKEKNDLIAKLTAAVEKPGDVAKGKQVFIQNCAACHKFGNDGRDVGPALNGMGAHGPAELLVSIIDPNRAVEPNYLQWMVRTNNGENLDGVIVRENNNSLTLRNAAGEREVKIADIKKRTNTGISLMPNGFESLGEEALRDLLAYMCSADQKYRLIDLNEAFTADSRKGLFISPTNLNDTLKFSKFGVADVEGVPFNIVAPEKTRAGKNLLVLKGGPGNSFSAKMPNKVEVRAGFAAKKLHFLGGVAGWGYPAVGEKVPVVKVTLHYVGGATETLEFKNGEEFADYIAPIDVPGSKPTKGLVNANQLRWFSKDLQSSATIEKITLESPGNGVAPVLVSITAELLPK